MQTLNNTLLFQLHKIYHTERKAKAALKSLTGYATSHILNEEIEKQIARTDRHLKKLDRIFDYLMQEPAPGKSLIVKKQLQDTKEMLAATHSARLRNLLVLNFFQNVNACKVSGLRIAYTFSAELGLDTVSDLLQQILESAYETGRTLSVLAVAELNNIEDLVEV